MRNGSGVGQPKGSGGTRADLLDAAGRIVARDGVTRLTLDAVAAEAGVSKGGVLYHFRTKDALVQGFVDGVAVAFERDLDTCLAAENDRPGAPLRAYVRAATMPDPVPHLTAGLIAALAWRPALGDAIRDRFRGWHARAMAGAADPAMARAVCLAADGVWLSACFGYGLEEGSDRDAVADSLLRMADLAANPVGGPP